MHTRPHPLFITFLLVITSIFILPSPISLSMASSFAHRLLVLNILNLEMLLKSSTCQYHSKQLLY